MTRSMAQVKFTIDSGTAAAFKRRCAAEGISMTAVVYKWMQDGGPKKTTVRKAGTRPDRRRAVLEIKASLEDILQQEMDCRDAIPEAFQSRYETADQACEQLSQAIACLEDAF